MHFKCFESGIELVTFRCVTVARPLMFRVSICSEISRQHRNQARGFFGTGCCMTSLLYLRSKGFRAKRALEWHDVCCGRGREERIGSTIRLYIYMFVVCPCL
jgi:hypothetical protein